MHERKDYIGNRFSRREAHMVAFDIENPRGLDWRRNLALQIAQTGTVRNCNKLIELIVYGVATHFNFKNRDGYDLSLLNMLAYFCEGDREEMDFYFKLSALWRIEWDLDNTYRNRSITKAVTNYRIQLYRMERRKEQLAMLEAFFAQNNILGGE